MRQVPVFSEYLIVGDGRVARHFCWYFKLLGLPLQQWDRSCSLGELQERAKIASHILLLISDPEIEKFAHEHALKFAGKTQVHFSGSCTIPLIFGAHPLYTFSSTLYSLETYKTIPFVIEQGSELGDVLPGIPNPSYVIDPVQKKLYHALAVLGGNFTTILWEKVFKEFESTLNLPKAVAIPYLQQVCTNLSNSPSGESILTGPLVRGDRPTIQLHQDALEGDPFQGIYKAFVTAYDAISQAKQ